MPFKTWREANRAIALLTGPATPTQRKLARQAGIRIPLHMPRIIAATMIRLALREELDFPPPRPISDRYKTRLNILKRPSDSSVSPETEEEAEAWVAYLRLVRRRESLAELKLSEGDVVETKAGDVCKVSSIGREGKVFFKGGRGFSAWPDLISLVARKNDHSDSAKAARREAENAAALHLRSAGWSEAKSRDLAEFRVEDIATKDDIDELESVISAAKDERPIQKYLEENRHLLTALLGGKERYCFPQKRLGAEYVPDFIIGDVDSLGFRWVLIELETPRSGIHLKDGQLDEKARKGVSQIMSWRDWLSANISYARQRRSDNGLGLFDIREGSAAIVLVGRRARASRGIPTAQRYEFQQSNRIQIQSYDWLLERLRGAIRHQGPPGSNPHLIHNDDEDDT